MPHNLYIDKSPLVQEMALSGNRPLSEPILTQFYVAYGVTRPQWIKTDAWGILNFNKSTNAIRYSTSWNKPQHRFYVCFNHF